jgi:hypothetical protein
VLGLRDADRGLESFIYYLGSFFEEILNVIGFFQSGMELEGINGRTLPDLDDLYVIRCEMTCRLHV